RSGIYLQFIKGLMMSSTFDQVAQIIAETCDIPRDTITPESHAIDDLGIDSLDFLDIAFAIDKAFGIKLPLEKWTQEVNDGKATTEQYFVLKNLSARIAELVAAKGASAWSRDDAARIFSPDRPHRRPRRRREEDCRRSAGSEAEHDLRGALPRLSLDAGRAADRVDGASLGLAAARPAQVRAHADPGG